MLVGHLPFMGRLASRLVAGRDDAGVVGLSARQPCCASSALDQKRWTIVWMATPELVPGREDRAPPHRVDSLRWTGVMAHDHRPRRAIQPVADRRARNSSTASSILRNYRAVLISPGINRSELIMRWPRPITNGWKV